MASLLNKRTGNIIRGALYFAIGGAQLFFNHFHPSNLFTETPIYGVLLLLIAAFCFYRAGVSDGSTSLFGSQRN